MSVSSSTQSSDNNENTESNTIDTAPPLSKHTGHLIGYAHSYFIPLVITIVFCIVVVSTFSGKALNNHVTGPVSSDRAVALTSDTADRLIAITDTSAETEDTVESTVFTETDGGSRHTREVATTVAETTESDAMLITADSSSTAATAEQPLSPEINKTYSRQYPAVAGRQNQMAYGLPDHYLTGNKMWQQRRRSHQEAIRSRRDHMIKMDEYRAAELRRLEQHRQHRRHRRMQKLERQNRNRRDQLSHRLEQQNKATNRPI